VDGPTADLGRKRRVHRPWITEPGGGCTTTTPGVSPPPNGSHSSKPPSPMRSAEDAGFEMMLQQFRKL